MNHPITRRGFLQGTIAGAAALATTDLAFGADEQSVIDTHVHVWDLKQFKLPWLKPDAPFAKNFLIGDYEKATDGQNVTKCIYMEVDVDVTQKQAEAEWIRGVCEKGKTPFVGAVVGADVLGEGFEKYAKQFKGDKYIKGLRQVLHNDTTPAGLVAKADFVKRMQLLGELGLTFDLCVRHAEIPDMTKLVTECAGTTFVLDHCGNPNVQAEDHSAWKKSIDAIAKNKNVYGKISGILFTAKPYKWTPEDIAPIVNHMFDSFGPDRVIFASDWPVCLQGGTFKSWLDALKLILKERKLADRQKFFHDNAVKLYGLKV